jgi:hypothetical protein
MALRIARGLIRLWLVLSVLWIGGVGVATWWTLPVEPKPWWVYAQPVEESAPEFDPSKPSTEFNPKEYEAFKLAEERRSAIWHASLLAFLPPAFVLALGSALGWVFRGFR